MKKIFLCLLVVLLLVGCTKSKEKTKEQIITLGDETDTVRVIGEYDGKKVGTFFSSVEYKDGYDFSKLLDFMESSNMVANDGGTTVLKIKKDMEYISNKEFIITVCHQINVNSDESYSHYEGYIIGTNYQNGTKCSVLNEGYDVIFGNDTENLTEIGEYNKLKVYTTFDNVEFKDNLDINKLISNLKYSDFIYKDGGTRELVTDYDKMDIKSNKEFKVIHCNSLVASENEEVVTAKGYILTLSNHSSTICHGLVK